VAFDDESLTVPPVLEDETRMNQDVCDVGDAPLMG